jgi:hypothetical protein
MASTQVTTTRGGNLGALPSVFKQYKELATHKDDLGTGIQAGFGVITYKGKTWGSGRVARRS